MSKAFLSLVLCCGSLWATTTGSASISASGRTGSCSESTTTSGEQVSCDLGFSSGGGTAVFSTDNYLSLSASTSAFTAVGPNAAGATAVATASFDQWFVITGGIGPGMVESFWSGGQQDGVRLIQNGVPSETNSVGRFWVISPFEYNVPFEITGSITAFSDAIFQGDSFQMSEFLQPQSLFVDLNGNQLAAVAVQVPEPSNAGSLLIGLAIGLFASSCRAHHQPSSREQAGHSVRLCVESFHGNRRSAQYV